MPAAAKELCSTCPVTEECMKTGSSASYGVWGGVNVSKIPKNISDLEPVPSRATTTDKWMRKREQERRDAGISERRPGPGGRTPVRDPIVASDGQGDLHGGLKAS